MAVVYVACLSGVISDRICKGPLMDLLE